MTNSKIYVLKKASLPACLCALMLWRCTDVPEPCSDTYRYPNNSRTEFCYGNTVVKKCGGGEYDPTAEFCSGNTIIDRCGGSEYDPSEESCYGGTTVYPQKCPDGSEYDPLKNNPCDNGVTHPDTTRYKVTFNTNGGTPATIAPVIVDSGATLEGKFPNPPTKDSSEFVGWFDKDSVDIQYDAMTKIIGDVELFAKWKDTTDVVTPPDTTRFTVKFNTNGGTPAIIDSVVVDSGAALGAKFPDPPEKAGDTFGGWFDSVSKQYTDTTTITKSVSLTARWTPVVPDPMLDGYFCNSTGTCVAISTQSDWEACPTENRVPSTSADCQTQTTFTIKFNANYTDGTVTPSSDTTGADGKLTALPATPARAGYDFAGWFTAAAGGDSVAVGKVYTADTTIYARWTPTPYKILYTLNGGSVEIENPTTYTIETEDFKLTNPTRADHTFNGWTGTNGMTPQTDVSIAQGSIGDRSYTANWTKNKYPVTFSKAGNGATGANVYESGALVVITAGTPPEGQVFVKWTTTSDGVNFADSSKSSTSFIMPANAVELTAIFSIACGTTPYNDSTHFCDGRDKKPYGYVKIGHQTWMAENLNYDTLSSTSGSYCYGNNNDNCKKYGRLYNWSTVMNGDNPSASIGPQGICPAGWHVPSSAEWQLLVDNAGGNSTAATGLKSQAEWNGTDDFGFSALPGGIASGVAPTPYFLELGTRGQWWSATEMGTTGDYVYGRSLYSASTQVHETNNMKISWFSVRCVRN